MLAETFLPCLVETKKSPLSGGLCDSLKIYYLYMAFDKLL